MPPAVGGVADYLIGGRPPQTDVGNPAFACDAHACIRLLSPKRESDKNGTCWSKRIRQEPGLLSRPCEDRSTFASKRALERARIVDLEVVRVLGKLSGGFSSPIFERLQFKDVTPEDATVRSGLAVWQTTVLHPLVDERTRDPKHLAAWSGANSASVFNSNSFSFSAIRIRTARSDSILIITCPASPRGRAQANDCA